MPFLTSFTGGASYLLGENSQPGIAGPPEGPRERGGPGLGPTVKGRVRFPAKGPEASRLVFGRLERDTSLCPTYSAVAVLTERGCCLGTATFQVRFTSPPSGTDRPQA